MRALTSWTELAVGLACLAAGWGAWRRELHAATAVLCIGGAVAVGHAALAILK